MQLCRILLESNYVIRLVMHLNRMPFCFVKNCSSFIQNGHRINKKNQDIIYYIVFIIVSSVYGITI